MNISNGWKVEAGKLQKLVVLLGMRISYLSNQGLKPIYLTSISFYQNLSTGV